MERGDYQKAAILCVDSVAHRIMQAGEGVAAAARHVVGGSSVKECDSVDPAFLHAAPDAGGRQARGADAPARPHE